MGESWRRWTSIGKYRISPGRLKKGFRELKYILLGRNSLSIFFLFTPSIAFEYVHYTNFVELLCANHAPSTGNIQILI